MLLLFGGYFCYRKQKVLREEWAEQKAKRERLKPFFGSQKFDVREWSDVTIALERENTWVYVDRREEIGTEGLCRNCGQAAMAPQKTSAPSRPSVPQPLPRTIGTPVRSEELPKTMRIDEDWFASSHKRRFSLFQKNSTVRAMFPRVEMG
eukprot:GHVO01010262.1.p1 GENE.GHVO01010262.1~~GHVO01010262.1.p1  ORF type:complete len:150 (+),score=7.19 GHVO01010262.1:98-547(+)